MRQPKYCESDGAELDSMADDPALPEYIEPLECPVCGRVYHHDSEAGTVEVDG